MVSDEGKLLREILESALLKRKKVPLHVATFPVGLDEAVQDFETTVGFSTGSENVHIAGIFGMGGSGKTTLAKEWFNRKRSFISRSSFLSNVRDTSKKTLYNLQKILLKDLGIQHPKFHTVDEGKTVLARGLKSLAVLIVLDDVDDDYQLDALLPTKDNFGRGSFIIVTTRDQNVLTTWGISSNYPMKLLNASNAKQLLCRHAFQPGFEFIDESYHNYEDLINRFVEVCKGLPLSLKVLGAMLKNKSKSYWESQLRKICRILPGEIVECLKLSYETLDSEDQHMFLDAACFLLGEEKSLVIAIWDGSGWSGEVGLETLVNKCLVTINNKDCIEMHDHLRDLGRTIAEDSFPSRIWKEEQINIQKITQIRGIVFDRSMDRRSTLEKIRPSLCALQLLAVREHDFREQFVALSEGLVWLRVHGFGGTNLPSWVSFGNLTVLELYDTPYLEELWQDNTQLPLQLRILIISIHQGTSFPVLPRSIGRLKLLKKIVLNSDARVSGIRSLYEEFCRLESLEFLELTGFPMLLSLPDHFGKLTNLRWLALKKVNLTALPDSFGNLTNLQTLELGGQQLTALPDSFGNLTNLQTLRLGGQQLKALPDSFGHLTNLQILRLWREQLTALPDSLGDLTNLQTLRLRGEQLTALPDSFGNLTNLQTLELRGEQLKALPDSFGNLTNLQTLALRGQQLTALPDSFGNLTNLQTLELLGEQLTALPDSFGNLTNLQILGLRGEQLTALPDSFGNLTNLQALALRGEQLTALPGSFGNLTNLQALALRGQQLTALPDSFGNLTNLGGEQLTALPDSFGNLTNLQTVGLRGEQLTVLPDSFGNVTNLQALALQGQQLTALPDSFGNVTNLQTLALWGEQLTALPDSFGNLTNLGGEQLTALPDSFGNLTNLQPLALRVEQLTALPDSFGNLTNLQALALRGDQLTALPDSFGNLTNLQTLVLWGEQLTALPDSFGNLTNLQTLGLGGQQLTALPDSFGNLTNLRTLALWGQQLTALPDSFGNLTNLETLALWGEHLTGLPDSLGNLTNLQTLGLGGQQLMALPDSFGNLTNLQTLGLLGERLESGNLTNLGTPELEGDQLTELPRVGTSCLRLCK